MTKRSIIAGAVIGLAGLALIQVQSGADVEQADAPEVEYSAAASAEESFDVFKELESSSAAASETAPARPQRAAESGQPGVKRASANTGELRLRPVQVMDTQGFGRPLVAATILVPTHWQTRGGVVWQLNNSGCGKNNPHYNWSAIAPDGAGMISLLPDETWTGNSNGIQSGQCPNVMTNNAREVVLNYIQRYRPNSQIIQYYDRTSDVKDVFAGIQPSRRDAFGNETRQWYGAGQALISYQVGAATVREIIGTAVLFTAMSMQGGYGMPAQQYLTIGILPGYAMRMPEGQLDLNQAEMIRKSIRPGKEWNQEMARHRAKIAGINRKGAMNRSRIIAKSNREISEINRKSWENTQKSNDRMHREFSEYVRGVETYDDPNSSTGTVELDNTYDHAYRLDNGDYVLTNDHSFNPYAEVGQGAEELTPTR